MMFHFNLILAVANSYLFGATDNIICLIAAVCCVISTIAWRKHD